MAEKKHPLRYVSTAKDRASTGGQIITSESGGLQNITSFWGLPDHPFVKIKQDETS
jgi:hypothetical protein